MKYIWSTLVFFFLLILSFYSKLLDSLGLTIILIVTFIFTGMIFRTLKEQRHKALAQLGFGLIWGSVAFVVACFLLILLLAIYLT